MVCITFNQPGKIINKQYSSQFCGPTFTDYSRPHFFSRNKRNLRANHWNWIHTNTHTHTRRNDNVQWNDRRRKNVEINNNWFDLSEHIHKTDFKYKFVHTHTHWYHSYSTYFFGRKKPRRKTQAPQKYHWKYLSGLRIPSTDEINCNCILEINWQFLVRLEFTEVDKAENDKPNNNSSSISSDSSKRYEEVSTNKRINEYISNIHQRFKKCSTKCFYRSAENYPHIFLRRASFVYSFLLYWLAA